MVRQTSWWNGCDVVLKVVMMIFICGILKKWKILVATVQQRWVYLL